MRKIALEGNHTSTKCVCNRRFYTKSFQDYILQFLLIYHSFIKMLQTFLNGRILETRYFFTIHLNTKEGFFNILIELKTSSSTMKF